MCEQDCVTWALPQGLLGNARWCQEPSRGERKWQAEGDCGAHHLSTRLERQGRAPKRLWIVIRALLPPTFPPWHPKVFCHPRKVQRLIANWFFFPFFSPRSLSAFWYDSMSGRKTVLNWKKKIKDSRREDYCGVNLATWTTAGLWGLSPDCLRAPFIIDA